jgi:hypothetical protein
MRPLPLHHVPRIHLIGKPRNTVGQNDIHVRKLQKLSPTEPTTPPPTMVNTSPNIDICSNILQQIESQTILEYLKDLMSIAPCITKHIWQHFCLKATSFMPVRETATIAVHYVVAVNRHMPIILAKIGIHKIRDGLLDGGSDINVITNQTMLPQTTKADTRTLQITNDT